MIIVLIGYMGSGKSSIGKDLSRALAYNFIDLDDYIENKEESLIPAIFKEKGEIYFRKLETTYLNEILKTKDKIVLSLGGGTPCYGNNMSLIVENKNVKSIYLKASIPELSKRLFNAKASRPLISHLKTEEDLQEFIGKHLFERNNFYNLSKFSLTTDSKKIEDITEEIIMKLI